MIIIELPVKGCLLQGHGTFFEKVWRMLRGLDLSAGVCGMQVKAGISEEIIDVMTNTNAELSKGRRKRSVPAGTAAMDDVRSFSLLNTIPLHKTTQVGIPSRAGWLSGDEGRQLSPPPPLSTSPSLSPPPPPPPLSTLILPQDSPLPTRPVHPWQHFVYMHHTEKYLQYADQDFLCVLSQSIAHPRTAGLQIGHKEQIAMMEFKRRQLLENNVAAILHRSMQGQLKSIISINPGKRVASPRSSVRDLCGSFFVQCRVLGKALCPCMRLGQSSSADMLHVIVLCAQ